MQYLMAGQDREVVQYKGFGQYVARLCWFRGLVNVSNATLNLGNPRQALCNAKYDGEVVSHLMIVTICFMECGVCKRRREAKSEDENLRSEPWRARFALHVKSGPDVRRKRIDVNRIKRAYSARPRNENSVTSFPMLRMRFIRSLIIAMF